MLTRRSLLAAAAAAATGARARALAHLAPFHRSPLRAAMPVPPVLRPIRRTATTDYYRMTIRQTVSEILPGTTSPVLTFDGHLPGPTIRACAERRVVVVQHNLLSEPVAVHLHGGVVAPQDDGYPMDLIPPGGSRAYVYPNHQAAATLWYHDHAHHLEAEHVYRGLSGFYLVSDERERRLALPGGEFDLPIMIRNAALTPEGRLVYSPEHDADRTTLLANGKPRPRIGVAARMYRLRLLNGSNEGRFELSLSHDGEFVQIASDRGLLPAPFRTRAISLCPGERADVLVDFARHPLGTPVVLRSRTLPSPEATAFVRFDVVRPGSGPEEAIAPEWPVTLPHLPQPMVEREFLLKMDKTTGAGLINGRVFDPSRIDFEVRRGSAEIWRITNLETSRPHSFHVHLTHFVVLDVNGRPALGGPAGLKDTVFVGPGDTVRIHVAFNTPYLGRYVYHCHHLDHAARGMMGQLLIVD